MKITELMIGDWVFNKFHKKNIKLTAYDFFTHGHDEDGLQRLNQFSRPALGRDLEPIPLTDESIEKNGFKPFPIENVISRNLVGKWWHKSGSIYVKKYILGQGEYVYMVGLDSHIRMGGLKFVHQLQNTLRICGLGDLADNFKLEEGGVG